MYDVYYRERSRSRDRREGYADNRGRYESRDSRPRDMIRVPNPSQLVRSQYYDNRRRTRSPSRSRSPYSSK